jgi:hypothetical protein
VGDVVVAERVGDHGAGIYSTCWRIAAARLAVVWTPRSLISSERAKARRRDIDPHRVTTLRHSHRMREDRIRCEPMSDLLVSQAYG